MPKSKNRRKSKRSDRSASTASGALPATPEVLGSAEEAGPEAKEAPKAQKVSTFQFFRQVRDEGQKVTWTSRSETLVSTIMVLIMVAIASVFFFLVDQVLRWIVPMILSINL